MPSKGPVCANHARRVCAQCVVITDAARRMCDQINVRIVFGNPVELARSWMAFTLEDGETDGVLYPSKREAIRHQSNEFLYCYFSFRRCMGGANRKDCQLFLDINRHAYESGMRLADPESPDLIMPLARQQGRWPL